MASQRDDERDEQPAASQSDDKPEWRWARVETTIAEAVRF